MCLRETASETRGQIARVRGVNLYLVLPRAQSEDVRPAGAAAQFFVLVPHAPEPAAGEEQLTSGATDVLLQLSELEREFNLQLNRVLHTHAPPTHAAPLVLQREPL